MSGFFISLEGGEGGGKTTQGKRLVEWLEQQGHEVVYLRNHAATPASEKIREMRLSGSSDIWLPKVQALLLFAVWHDLWNRVIKPALDAGKVVVSDRFIDSTFIYQGYVNDTPISSFDPLHEYAIGGAMPNLTLLFDLPVELGMSRIAQRTLDHFETRGTAFHEKVREGYLAQAAKDSDRYVIIDATQSQDAVFNKILAMVNDRMQKKAA